MAARRTCQFSHFIWILFPLLNWYLAIEGGSADPETNHALAAVVKRAKSQGVPRDNIDKALKKVRPSLFELAFTF